MSYSHNQRLKHIKQIKKAPNPNNYYFEVAGKKKTLKETENGWETVDYYEKDNTIR